jgi:hypothetical protein
MPSIFDMLESVIGDQETEKIAKQIGADPRKTRDAIAVTLPTMVEALARKAERPEDVDALHEHLRNSDYSSGSMLDQLNAQFGESNRGAGYRPNTVPTASRGSSDEILPSDFQAGASSGRGQPSPSTSQPKPAPRDVPLDDLFSGKRKRVEDSIGKSSGLGPAQIGSLIAILGPILFSVLGSKAKSGQLNPSDLDGMLKSDRAKINNAPGGSLLGKLLDQDGDGDFDFSDIIKLGMSFFFSPRR